MQKQAGMLDRVILPTRIIVNRVELTPTALAQVLQSGEISPGGSPVCELEAGGQVLARGRVVKRRGTYWFEVTECAEEGRK